MTGLLGWYVPGGRIPRRAWWLGHVLAIALVGLAAPVVDATLFPGGPVRFDNAAVVPGLGWLVLLVTAELLGTRPYRNRFGPLPR